MIMKLQRCVEEAGFKNIGDAFAFFYDRTV